MITTPETLATVASIAMLIILAGIVALACLNVGTKRSHLEDAAVRPDPETEDKPRRYTMEDFKTQKIAIECETQEQFKAALEECEKCGLLWLSGFKPTERLGRFFPRIRIMCHEFYRDRIWFEDKNNTRVEDHGYISVPFSAFDFLSQDTPCPAIQEAQRRLADMPQVVAVTSPKMTRMEALQLATAKNAEKAQKRAEAAADFLREGACADDAAMSFGYASVDSMRKALARYGYRMNGQPKEAHTC